MTIADVYQRAHKLSVARAHNRLIIGFAIVGFCCILVALYTLLLYDKHFYPESFATIGLSFIIVWALLHSLISNYVEEISTTLTCQYFLDGNRWRSCTSIAIDGGFVCIIEDFNLDEMHGFKVEIGGTTWLI